jgi:predicted amidohydrolase YtcJ
MKPTMLEARLGWKRAERSSYTFQSLLDGGAQVALGSDWFVRIFADTSSN